MGTQTGYSQRMPKAAYTPSDEDREMLAALEEAHAEVGRVTAKYRQILADCAARGIPVAKLAETVKVERKTIYRHLGRSMT